MTRRLLIKDKQEGTYFEIEYAEPGWYIQGRRKDIIWPDVVPDNAHYIDIDNDLPTHEYYLPEPQSWWKRFIRWIISA
jgi:hypothetical protein